MLKEIMKLFFIIINLCRTLDSPMTCHWIWSQTFLRFRLLLYEFLFTYFFFIIDHFQIRISYWTVIETAMQRTNIFVLFFLGVVAILYLVLYHFFSNYEQLSVKGLINDFSKLSVWVDYSREHSREQVKDSVLSPRFIIRCCIIMLFLKFYG